MKSLLNVIGFKTKIQLNSRALSESLSQKSSRLNSNTKKSKNFTKPKYQKNGHNQSNKFNDIMNKEIVYNLKAKQNFYSNNFTAQRLHLIYEQNCNKELSYEEIHNIFKTLASIKNEELVIDIKIINLYILLNCYCLLY